METGGNFEQKVVIHELLQGYELAKQLQNHIDPASPAESLAHRVLSSFNNALSMLKFFEYGGEPQPTAPNSGRNSPHSVSGSPRSDNSNRSDCRDVSKKRKMLPKWSKKVKICPTTGMEGPPDDGNSWRKYGQKDILGSKYPRGYYRCTHRFVEGCPAKKQVQRTEEDPTVFHVIYQGTHTCTQSAHQIRRSGSFEIQEQNNHNQQEQQQPLLLNFGADLKLKRNDIDCGELNSSTFSFPPTSIAGGNAENCIFSSASFDNQFMGSFSSPFISPATSESNYFSLSPCHMSSYSGVPNMLTPESDLNEIISAVTSASNSPLLDLDFTLEQIDPSLQFDTSSFLS